MPLYPSLPTATSIRLLVLRLGRRGDDLIGSFQVQDLNTAHADYEALSYYWGPQIFPQEIHINGSAHNITQTLYDALVSLRLPDTDRVLWADAVCINQSLNKERNHQVRLMKEIYSQCSRCVIYLGQKADGSELVPDLVQCLQESSRRHLRNIDLAATPKIAIPSTLHKQYDLPDANDAGWAAIRRLTRRPWFGRVWIIQEFALPKETIMVCGDWQLEGYLLPDLLREFSSRVMLGALFMDETNGDHDPNTAGCLHSLGFFRQLVLCSQREQQIEDGARVASDVKSATESLQMFRLLLGSKFFSATDPRDLVYGLLGLASDVHDKPSLRADYGKTLSEIEADFYVYFLESGLGYDILSTRSRNASLPRWMGSLAMATNSLHSAAPTSQESVDNADELRRAVALDVDRKVTAHGRFLDRVVSRTRGCWEGAGSSLLKELPAMMGRMLYEKEELQASAWLDLHPAVRTTCVRLVTKVISLASNKPDIAELRQLELCEKHFDWLLGGKGVPEVLAATHGSFDAAVEFLKEWQSVSAFLWKGRDACFGATGSACFGMFPKETVAGDQIFMIDGLTKTFLVRHQPQADTYSWLGEVYVHGLDTQIQKVIAFEHLQKICLGRVPQFAGKDSGNSNIDGHRLCQTLPAPVS